ncbi:hypothetical protein K439DRAFT_1625012 [Ramaria rubella]|nr:hypothetical protein K439DRAFT_1625012 [Ramaria rubella]
MNPPEQAVPQLPHCHATCPRCSSAFGPFTVCKGTTKPQNRGRVMQLCSNRLCHYAVYFSGAYPVFSDAENIAAYFNLHAPFVAPAPPFIPPDSPPIHQQQPAFNFLPNPALPPPALTFAGKHPCTGLLCRTRKKGKKTCKGCPFTLCLACCSQEALNASNTATVRQSCGVHAKAFSKLVKPPIPLFHPPAPNPPISPASAPVQLPQFNPANLAVALPASSPTQLGTNTVIRGHLLSTSIGPLWSKKAMAVAAHVQGQRDQRNASRQLKIAVCKHVIIMIWASPNTKPFRLRFDVDTFPHFSLGLVVKYVKDLQILEDDCVLTWNPKQFQWEHHMLSTSRVVKYKLTRSVMMDMPDDVCIGLAEEFDTYPELAKHKQSLDMLTLPIEPSPSSSSISLPSSALPTSSSGSSLLSPSPAFAFSPLLSSHATLTSSTHAAKKLSRRSKAFTKGKSRESRKRWPGEWHVSAIAAGFKYIEKGRKQCRKIPALFKEFFKQPIVCSTYNKICKMWRDIDDDALKQ